jgi:hypothetical protein
MKGICSLQKINCQFGSKNTSKAKKLIFQTLKPFQANCAKKANCASEATPVLDSVSK